MPRSNKSSLPGLTVVAIIAMGLPSTLTASDAEMLGPEHLLILVNLNSPVSISVANLYREYYPEIPDNQVLYLTGLPDCASVTAGPAQEIITRAQYETLIAQPVRGYLVAMGLEDQILCLMTTAGMPYRIADSDPALANVVTPGASDPSLTATNRYKVDAACVESELSVVLLADPALNTVARAPSLNRLVNPYQAYRDTITCWLDKRDVLTRRNSFRWTYMWRVSKGPRLEGIFNPDGFSAKSRLMCPGDIYLVARLDGPRRKGQLPIFAVSEMLRRSATVSDPSHPGFKGYNRRVGAVVIDGAPAASDRFSYAQVYNCPPSSAALSAYWNPVPPGAEAYSGQFYEVDHYSQCFSWLTGTKAPVGGTAWAPIDIAMLGSVLWVDTNQVVNQSSLRSGMGLFALLTYGRNSNDGRRADYLLTGGPSGGPLFKCVPGAVFSSLESFNAVTMFTDTPTGQGKIAEFIEMGGTAAVGHVFEPERGALFQGDFLLHNLLRDDNRDGIGDMTWVEAAFSAMPYLSWSELVLGDPLMRLRTGPGGLVQLQPWPGDTNWDGIVDYGDLSFVLQRIGSSVGSANYHPDADLNRSGQINWDDFNLILNRYGTVYQ